MFLLSAEYSSNVQCLARNLSDLTMVSSQYDILLCTKTLVSDMYHVWRCWFSDLVTLSCCASTRCLMPKGWLLTLEMVTEHLTNQNFSVVVAKCRFLGFVVWDRSLCVQSLSQPWPRWPDFLLFTTFNGCCAVWGYPCLCPVSGWFECLVVSVHPGQFMDCSGVLPTPNLLMRKVLLPVIHF